MKTALFQKFTNADGCWPLNKIKGPGVNQFERLYLFGNAIRPASQPLLDRIDGQIRFLQKLSSKPRSVCGWRAWSTSQIFWFDANFNHLRFMIFRAIIPPTARAPRTAIVPGSGIDGGTKSFAKAGATQNSTRTALADRYDISRFMIIPPFDFGWVPERSSPLINFVLSC